MPLAESLMPLITIHACRYDAHEQSSHRDARVAPRSRGMMHRASFNASIFHIPSIPLADCTIPLILLTKRYGSRLKAMSIVGQSRGGNGGVITMSWQMITRSQAPAKSCPTLSWACLGNSRVLLSFEARWGTLVMAEDRTYRH
jgi:hypothetical protein